MSRLDLVGLKYLTRREDLIRLEYLIRMLISSASADDYLG